LLTKDDEDIQLVASAAALTEMQARGEALATTLSPAATLPTTVTDTDPVAGLLVTTFEAGEEASAETARVNVDKSLEERAWTETMTLPVPSAANGVALPPVAEDAFTRTADAETQAVL